MGLLGGDGGESGFEKVDNRGKQGVVSFVGAEGFISLGGLSDSAVAFAVFPIFLAEDADSGVLPNAFDHDFSVRIDGALYGLAAGAHCGEQAFAAVNAVPEKFRMSRFEVHGAKGFDGLYLSECAVARVLRGASVTQGG
ncbi:MAG: hypothetical protein RIS92_882 [Verrucomicrobiota bacterium]